MRSKRSFTFLASDSLSLDLNAPAYSSHAVIGVVQTSSSLVSKDCSLVSASESRLINAMRKLVSKQTNGWASELNVSDSSSVSSLHNFL